MREPYTWKKVVTDAITGPFDPEIYQEFWEGLKKSGYAVLALIARTALLLSFPLSIPAVYYILQLPAREQGPWWYMLTIFIIGYIVAIMALLVLYT